MWIEIAFVWLAKINFKFFSQLLFLYLAKITSYLENNIPEIYT